MKKHVFADAKPNPKYVGVKDVSPQQVYDARASVHLIDVRRPDEYDGELGHIKGSQLLVLDTLPERLSEIPKGETVVLICRSGNRSAQASAFLKEQGYEDTYNLAGGMLAWNEEKLDVEISD